MPVERHLQSTFASGEFDPLLVSREDVAYYYSSAKTLSNVVPLPQGGAKRREGLKRVSLQRGKLTSLSGYTVTAPNGGTANNAFSGASAVRMITTTGIGTTAEYVIIHVDFGASQRVSLMDFAAELFGGNQSSATISLQSSTDDITFTTRASLVIGEGSLSLIGPNKRRFALAPDNDFATARYWRIIVDNPGGATDFGTDVVDCYDGQFYTEAGYSAGTPDLGEAQLKRITTSITDEYYAVLTDRNCDIYTTDGVWQAAVEITHTDDEIAEIKSAQNLDTLVLYQEDNFPWIVQRLDGIDDRWRAAQFQFDTISQFPFADSTSGGQNEIQFIKFNGMSAGDEFVFEYNGDVSTRVVWNATMATNVTNINAALEGLEDITSVTVTDDGSNDVQIEFDGVDANTFFAIIIVDILTGSGTAEVSREQYGRPNQENILGSTRGYPRCGTFYQGRHWMAGFRSRPDVIVASRVGALDDFKEDAEPVATSPLVLAPDTDEQVTVESLHPGRNLQIFTSSAEIYIPEEPITPFNVALKVSSRRGTQVRTQPVDVQGGTFFVDRNGTNIREYLFTDAEDSYTAEPISTLGGHLVQNPLDMALRLSRDTDEPTLLYIVNSGRDRDFNLVPAAICTVDRAQQVTAFARMETPGVFKAVASTQAGDAAALVQRELAGEEWTYLELFDEDFYSDCAEEFTNTEVDEFTATASQTVFTYTFSNPGDTNDIAIFQRGSTAQPWTRIEQADYTLDTGAKTITLDTGLDAGTLVIIAKRQTSISGISDYLEGIEVYLHGDGRHLGLHTPSMGSITISGGEGYWITAQLGLRMVPNIVLQAFKGKGGTSPTMQKQRIFRALVNVNRTVNCALCLEDGTPRAIALLDYDGALYDQDLEEILFTGLKRVSGIGSWVLEPRLRITQTEPGPFTLRSVAYDIRF